VHKSRSPGRHGDWFVYGGAYICGPTLRNFINVTFLRPRILICVLEFRVGRDNPVGIATRYGLDCPQIVSRWGARYSSTVQAGPGGHPASYIMVTGSFPGIKRPGRGVDRPHQEPMLKKE